MANNKEEVALDRIMNLAITNHNFSMERDIEDLCKSLVTVGVSETDILMSLVRNLQKKSLN